MTYIKSLALYNFRNYHQQKVEFSPKINLFVGQNGQGKTNCLEAIALFIAGRSFRSLNLQDCIRHEQNSFFLQCDFSKENIDQTLSIHFSAEKKQLQYNANTYSHFLPLIGILQGVLFAGFYDQLIKGAPQIRRKFIDLQSAQIDPLYLQHLRHFHKALKERNFLLKKRETKILSIYEELMAKSIPYLLTKRLDCLNILQKYSQQIHQELTDLDDRVELKYTSPFLPTLNIQSCLDLIQKNRFRDEQIGYTHIGPHKDELLIYLNALQAKKFGSEGQIQTLMTSIYLAEYFRLQESLPEKPIFCIDDLGQNLDFSRQKRLLQKLEQMGQVFITSPEIPPYSFGCDHAIFEVKNGQIETLSLK